MIAFYIAQSATSTVDKKNSMADFVDNRESTIRSLADTRRCASTIRMEQEGGRSSDKPEVTQDGRQWLETNELT